jgi:endo-1,4-beta-xylanase
MRRALTTLGRIAPIVGAVLLLAAPCTAAARTGQVELGTAVGGPPFGNNATYRGVLELYDSLTAENDMKMYYQRPSQATFDFAVGDAMTAFAEAHGQKMHGHTLVWCNDSANPGWLRNRSWTRTQLLQVLDEHITTVVAHYRGHVSSWDVVNEALADDGARRDCLWQRVIGDDWVEQAFRMARRADPDVPLFYNEVRADIVNPKYEAMLALARDFLARGVPLDGLGLQYHLGDYKPTQPEIEEAIRRIGELGLDVHLSELDVPIWGLGSTLEAKLARQAAIYRTVAAACQAQPACFRITTWGFTDNYTYRCCDARPLPFDFDYRPKAAWSALQEVLRPSAPPATPVVASPPPTQAQAAAVSARRLALSAVPRRQRLRTLLRRHGLGVVLKLSGAESARVQIVARLRGRILGRLDISEVAETGGRTVIVPLGRAARRLLRQKADMRLVLVAVATDPAGRRAKDRSVIRP